MYIRFCVERFELSHVMDIALQKYYYYYFFSYVNRTGFTGNDVGSVVESFEQVVWALEVAA